MKIKDLYRLGEKVLGGHGIGNLPIINDLNAKAIEHLKNEFVIIDGNKMFLDEKDSLLLSINKIYEKNETNFVKDSVNKGDIVIDIGANIGYYTLMFAKLVGDTGKIYSFEPDPRNFFILEKNIQINGYNNVILEKKAVSNKLGKSTLYVNENSAESSMHKPNNVINEIYVDLITLDNYFEVNSITPDFIKIDIEGYELNALKGMESILQSSNKTKIMIEYNPLTKKELKSDPMDNLTFLSELGFKFKDLNSRVQTFLTFEDIKQKYENSKKLTNFICIKNSSEVKI